MWLLFSHNLPLARISWALSDWRVKSLVQRRFCLVVENNNHFPHSYFQAVLCDQKASPANCRAASIKVSQFSDNIIFLGHCFSLKEVWDNKYTYTSELLIFLRVARSSQHAVRQDEGVLCTLLARGPHGNHNTDRVVFYSSSLRVT